MPGSSGLGATTYFDTLNVSKSSRGEPTSQDGVVEVPSWEIVLFVIAAVVAGGLSMGGVTLVYFLDQWREHPESTERAESARGETRRA